VPQLFADGVIDPAVFISDRLLLADYSVALERFATGWDARSRSCHDCGRPGLHGL
jgi:hypothetical protein